MNKPTGSIAHMEAFPSLLQSSENERRLQLEDRPIPGSYGEYLARTNRADNRESWNDFLSENLRASTPTFDAQAEHEKDLEYESRVDYASWETDGREDQ